MTDPARPQPVKQEFNLQGAMSGLIVAIGGIVFTVKAGVNAGNLASLASLVGTVTSIIAGGAVWWSHRKSGQAAAAQVTPLESPQGYDGQPLLTADQWAARWGKHARQPAAPVTQQEPDEAWTREIKASAPEAGLDYTLKTYDDHIPSIGPASTPEASVTASTPTRRLGRLPNDRTKPRVELTALEPLGPVLTRDV